MAIATSTAIALALAAAAAGTSYYNTQNTAKKQDNALATQLRGQGDKQRKADAKVNAEVERLKGSTAEESRRKGLDSYSQALRQGKHKLESGLTPNFGSDAFRADSAEAAQGVQRYGADTAGLLARMDAPSQQRQAEAFGYGNLATDLNLIGREAQGQNFLDELRLRAVRRNAGLDAAASFMGGMAGGIGSGAGAAGSAASAGGTGSLYAAGYRGLGSVGY